MIDFTIHHKIEPLNKVIAVELPMPIICRICYRSSDMNRLRS